jgi:hypothetical protein
MIGSDAARESALRDIVSSHKAVASGFLRLLSLDALRERLGDKWETRSDHIQFVTEAAIKRHLQRGQTFYQASDSGYVIVFDFDAEERAEFICRAISREIIQRLLGSSENKDENLAIEMRVAVIAGSQLAAGADLPGMLEQSLQAAPSKLISNTDEGADRKDAAPKAPPAARASDGTAAVAGHLGDLFLRNLLKEAQQRIVEGDPQSTATTLAELPGFESRYVPFWHVGSRAFLTYRFDPRFEAGPRGPIAVDSPGLDSQEIEARGMDSLGDMTGDPDLIRNLDHLVLNRAVLDLDRAIEAGAKYVAMVPIHVESLARDQDQKALLKFLEQQPAALLQLLSLEIVDTRKSKFNDLVRHIWMLKDRCRQIILRQETDRMPWLPSQHLPPGAVGMSVRIPGADVPELEIATAMNGFVKGVSQHGIETFVFGLRTRSLAFAAIGAGFSQVAGPAIAARSRTPSGVASAGMHDIFTAATP